MLFYPSTYNMKKNINIIYVIKINVSLQFQFIQNIFKNIIITVK